jgi:hypothetical protein
MAWSGSFASSSTATKGSCAAALLCAHAVSAPRRRRADHHWHINKKPCRCPILWSMHTRSSPKREPAGRPFDSVTRSRTRAPAKLSTAMASWPVRRPCGGYAHLRKQDGRRRKVARVWGSSQCSLVLFLRCVRPPSNSSRWLGSISALAGPVVEKWPKAGFTGPGPGWLVIGLHGC